VCSVVYTNSFTPPDPHPSVFSQALVSGFLDRALVITPVFIMPEDGLKDFTKTEDSKLNAAIDQFGVFPSDV